MSRLYFDCPIQAAYMAKEFGVKLHLDLPKKGGKSIGSIEHKIEIPNLGTNKFKKVVSLKTDGSDEGDVGWVDTGEQEYLSYTSGNDRIYVAKESEHIFEAKEADIVTCQLGCHNTVEELAILPYYDGTSKLSVFNIKGNIPFQQIRESAKIIMRNNKPFFTALVEGLDS